MTDDDDDDDPSATEEEEDRREAEDAALWHRVGQMLADEGALLPTDEREVRRAEAMLDTAEKAGDDVALPARLTSWPPAPAEETSPASPGRSPASRVEGAVAVRPPWLGYGLAALLGAAAAGAVGAFRTTSPSPMPPIGGDRAPTSSPSSTSPRSTTPLSLPPCNPAACCAGAQCATAEGGAPCPSGRACVACAVPPGSRFRVRLGGVIPEAEGVASVAAFPEGTMEVCLRPGLGPEVCTPTAVGARDEATWTRMPLVVARDDVEPRLRLRLRWRGVAEPKATVATASAPVTLTPRARCRGLVVTFETAKKTPFARTSVFFDDHHFVVLDEASPAAGALEARRLTFTLIPTVYATENASRRRVLAWGPYDLTVARALSAQLEAAGHPARITDGRALMNR